MLKQLSLAAMAATALTFPATAEARNQMLRRTHTSDAPWTIVHTDDKEKARLNIMRHLLKVLAPKDVAKSVKKPDPDVLFTFETAALEDGRLER